MAEAIFRARIEGRPWELSSAGFFADHPLPPVPEVIALLHLRGLSSEGLSSRALDKPLVKRATSIFAMTEMHLSTLRRQFPKEAAGAHLITDFSTLSEYQGKDIPDPIGGDQEDFEETFHILDDAIPQIIAHLDKAV